MAMERIREVKKDNCALVIIDMQNDFVSEGFCIECGEPGRATIPVIKKLKSWANQYDIPIIYTHEHHRADLSDIGREIIFEPAHVLDGSVGVEIVDELTPEEGDYHIWKRRYSAFMQTDLSLLLDGLKRDVIILVGVCTNICVYGTALEGSQLGYHPIVISDACAGTSIEFHEVFLRHVEFLVGDVTDSETLMSTLK